MSNAPIVIIGSGLAGYMLAKEIRKLDKTIPLLMITASRGRYYSKPQISTALTQKKDPTTLALNTAEQMVKQLSMEIITKTKVTAIDTKKKIIKYDKKNQPYEKLILAIGAEVIRAPIMGNAVQNIYSVNDLEDYAEFHKAIDGSKKRIAIMGAGLVGCEFANDLSNAGHEVHMIAPCEYPLDTMLPREIGSVLQKALTENGVTWYLEQLVTNVDKTDDGYCLTLSYQQQLTVDVVLSAIGLCPHTELAENAGIEINRGVVVDKYLNTSAADVYALGDCAEVHGLVQLFVAPLLRCARALAKTLTGDLTEVHYPAMPVVIKTPSCPLAVVPVPRNIKGDWQVSGVSPDIKALFYDENRQLQGFALTGKEVRNKVALLSNLTV